MTNLFNEAARLHRVWLTATDELTTAARQRADAWLTARGHAHDSAVAIELGMSVMLMLEMGAPLEEIEGLMDNMGTTAETAQTELDGTPQKGLP